MADATSAPSDLDPSAEEEPSDEPTPLRRALNVGAAVVPGALVHGTGHWAAGHWDAGNRLALAQAAGLGLFLLGGSTIALSGASRYLVAPSAALVIFGMGAFTTTWLADIYGVSLPYAARGAAPELVPWAQTELGYAHVYDPQFSYRHFLTQHASVRWGAIELEPSAWFALDDANARLALGVGYRLAGRVPGRESFKDGSYVDLGVAATHHTYAREGFRVATAEAEIAGRYDLARFSRMLRGAFVDGSLGLALQVFDYDIPGYAFGDEVESLLLSGFGFGAYLDHRGSLVSTYYDHRHDGYVGGLIVPGLGGGVVGHFGLRALVFVSESFGVVGEAEVGSAYAGRLAIVHRAGAAAP